VGQAKILFNPLRQGSALLRVLGNIVTFLGYFDSLFRLPVQPVENILEGTSGNSLFQGGFLI
jgi:hypothetical protein